MKVNEKEARRRLARLYLRESAMYEQAASFNRVEFKAACFRSLAALYRRAAGEVVAGALWSGARGFRCVDWCEVHELHRMAAA